LRWRWATWLVLGRATFLVAVSTRAPVSAVGGDRRAPLREREAVQAARPSSVQEASSDLKLTASHGWQARRLVVPGWERGWTPVSALVFTGWCGSNSVTAIMSDSDRMSGSGNTYVDVQREGVVLLVVGGGVTELVVVVVGGGGGGVEEVVDVVEVVVGGAGVELVEGGLEDVVGGVELELEDDDPPLQGWADSKSAAT
jgi:hypothetical protein